MAVCAQNSIRFHVRPVWRSDGPAAPTASRSGGASEGRPFAEDGGTTKAYDRTIFQQAAPEVWKITCDFNSCPIWLGGAGETRLALSDVERTQT
jgi:hypothetical protein